MRPSVERDHADIVDHLLENHHVSRRLHNLQVAVIDDVVVMDVVLGLAVFLIEPLLFVGGGFLFGEELVAGQIDRPFERRVRRVGPDALQIGAGVGHSRRCPFRRRGGRG